MLPLVRQAAPAIAVHALRAARPHRAAAVVTAAVRAQVVVAIAADTQADTPVEVTAVVDIPAVAVAVPVEVVLPDDKPDC